jgi:hypothetical protein
MARYRRRSRVSRWLRRARRSRMSGGFAVSAAGAGVALAVIAGQHPAPASTAARTSAQLAAGSGGTLSCAGLEGWWESAGGSPGAAFMAAEIAMAESGGRQYATDDNTNGTVDRGYWQVNSIHGALSTYDPAGNARAAVLLSGDGTDWGPWVTYATGAYQGKC